MSDDAVLMQGRQTKRKWKHSLALVFLALSLLGGAWTALHFQAVLEFGRTLWARILPYPSGAWISTDHGPEACAFLLGERVYFAEAGSLSALQLDGRVVALLETSLKAPQAVTAEKAAAVFDLGGNTLLRVSGQEVHTLDIPLGIDAVAVSDLGTLAVITAGSGYQTVTALYDADSNLIQEIGLSNEAMALMTFLKGSDTLATCVISADGTWHLRFYQGRECLDISLESAEIYDMKPCGQGTVLWTSQGFLCYSFQGELTAVYEFPPEQLLCWDSDSYTAAVLLEAGSPRVVTLTEDGTAACSAPLSRTPRSLSVYANRLCILDREALLVYDKHCLQKEQTALGALTLQIQAIPGGVLLFGDGQFMRYILK